uniref:Uncharacterized protein n=1 Tax=Avena sativa TaxID=4498 RepID=A0ACD5TKW1_AVESA
MGHVHTTSENKAMMSTEEFLQAQTELYNLSLAYVKSVALRASIDLQIPEAIHRRGGSATLSDIAAETGTHGTKVSYLGRLMRVLAISGVFSMHSDDGAVYYKLTHVSRLLVPALSPMVPVLVDPLAATALFSLADWFTDERVSELTLFEAAHGCTRSEMTAKKGMGGMFNAGMVADSRVLTDILLSEHGDMFEGVESLVDIGGGHGGVAEAIAKALPNMKCTVLDLPHVVKEAATGNVQFVAGDAFQYIPPADAVLLKWFLQLFNDEDAIKVLRRCREAIPAKGKVIIFDVVVGSNCKDGPTRETQLLFDIFMMRVGGREREEQQWRKIIFEAGFTDYKISVVLGFRSIIEVYP